jgi:DNA-binding transcriptional regulator YiaG
MAVPNIGMLLKEEISRLCRREIRRQVEPLRKTSAAYRHDIAALKRQIVELERRVGAIARRHPTDARPRVVPDGPPVRFVAKGLRSLRARLGVSAAELAQLMGVSAQSVYNWEHKKSTPRKEQLASLVALRSLGKREVGARLEARKAARSRKARSRS